MKKRTMQNQSQNNGNKILKQNLKLKHLIPVQELMKKLGSSISIATSSIEVLMEALISNNIVTDEQLAKAREIVTEKYRKTAIIRKYFNDKTLSIDEKINKIREEKIDEQTIEQIRKRLIELENSKQQGSTVDQKNVEQKSVEPVEQKSVEPVEQKSVEPVEQKSVEPVEQKQEQNSEQPSDCPESNSVKIDGQIETSH